MIFIRMPRFIRRFLRRTMNPVQVDQAITKQKKLSFAYAIISWNIFGFVLLQLYRSSQKKKVEDGDEMVPNAVYYAKLLDIPKAEVIRFQGTKILSDKVLERVDGKYVMTDRGSEDPNPKVYK